MLTLQCCLQNLHTYIKEYTYILYTCILHTQTGAQTHIYLCIRQTFCCSLMQWVWRLATQGVKLFRAKVKPHIVVPKDLVVGCVLKSFRGHPTNTFDSSESRSSCVLGRVCKIPLHFMQILFFTLVFLMWLLQTNLRITLHQERHVKVCDDKHK